MKIRPLHDRVIVKRLEEERTSAGGIVIPDTGGPKSRPRARVVFAGPGKTDESGKVVPMGVKPGDKVLFGKYSGQEFKLDGQDLLHMREDDIIGIVA